MPQRREPRPPAPPRETPSRAGPLLLYDGTCGLCAGSVQFVLRHDPQGPLRFAALQSPVGAEIVARHAALRGVDSMVWVERSAAAVAGSGATAGGGSSESIVPLERVYVRSDAVLRVCAYLGGIWSLCRIGYIVPRPLRDVLYATVARHRHRLLGERCLVPEPAQQHRFVTDDVGSGF